MLLFTLNRQQLTKNLQGDGKQIRFSNFLVLMGVRENYAIVLEPFISDLVSLDQTMFSLLAK